MVFPVAIGALGCCRDALVVFVEAFLGAMLAAAHATFLLFAAFGLVVSVLLASEAALRFGAHFRQRELPVLPQVEVSW